MSSPGREIKLAAECVKRARELLGPGWAHVSDDIRWGLVAANILAMQAAQDESIDPARIVARTSTIMDLALSILGGDKRKAEKHG